MRSRKNDRLSSIYKLASQPDEDDDLTENERFINNIIRKCLKANSDSKILQQGTIQMSIGLLFTKYEPFLMVLLSNGLIIFYELTPNSKRYGKKYQILQLDETLRISNKLSITKDND